MRIAAFGDIHGNIYALRAVLADLKAQSPDAMVVTGDIVYKFPWGAEVVDLLRSLPHQAVIGNSELYLALWETPLWPADIWNLPVAQEVVVWERARLGYERLGWLASLPEYTSFSGGRLEDLLVVHGVPGNPFLPFLPAPGEDGSPWVQTNARVDALLGGADAKVIVCGHSHTTLQRRVTTAHSETLIVNPGPLSYRRGRSRDSGWAGYALLDWSARAGWQVSLQVVRYDPAPLHQALRAMARGADSGTQENGLHFCAAAIRDNMREGIDQSRYPIAAFIANRVRPAGVEKGPEERVDYLQYRWGDAPAWWEERDALPAWRLLRQDAALPQEAPELCSYAKSW
jgi:predicted phosphodiesterase